MLVEQSFFVVFVSFLFFIVHVGSYFFFSFQLIAIIIVMIITWWSKLSHKIAEFDRSQTSAFSRRFFSCFSVPIVLLSAN